MSHFTGAFIFYLITIAVVIYSENEQVPDGECATYSEASITCDIPNQSVKGVCMPLNKCKAFQRLQRFSRNNSLQRLNFLRSVQCPTRTKEVNVCCPVNCSDYLKPELEEPVVVISASSDKYEQQTKPEGKVEQVSKIPPYIWKNECGKQISNRIYGGEIAELDEFPWMALLFYNSNEYGCSGALISNRHVLTAAHCVTGPYVRDMKGLKVVRLGEFNTRTQPDCIEERNYVNCADVAVDAAIGNIIVHPDYDGNSLNKENDIAIILLENPVPVSQFIMPICLPEEKERSILTPGRYFSVSGWGRTDLFRRYFPNIRSPIKLKLRVPLVTRNVCAGFLRRFGINLAPSQICAGGEPSKDTCAGDSGGPLMYFDRSNSRWVTYGIVSYGFRECGLPNYPAVYTNVLDFLDWIMKSIHD